MSARFDLESQSGETINNVGGDQHVHLTRNGRRLAAAGKAIALLGFALSLAALIGIGVVAYQTTFAVLDAWPDVTSPYSDYAPARWPVAVTALVGGLALGRLGRILGR